MFRFNFWPKPFLSPPAAHQPFPPGMENTSFLPNPALMVLASTAENHEGARVTGPRFSGSDKEGQPFSTSSFTMYRPGEHFGPPLYSPVSPFVRPAVDRSGRSGVGILNPVPSASAFRPLPAETSDNYHSAFSPAKRLKPEDLALKKQRDCNTELSEEGSEADEWKNREKEDRPSSISSINYDTNSETHSETGEHERGTPDSEGRSLRSKLFIICLCSLLYRARFYDQTIRPNKSEIYIFFYFILPHWADSKCKLRFSSQKYTFWQSITLYLHFTIIVLIGKCSETLFLKYKSV